MISSEIHVDGRSAHARITASKSRSEVTSNFRRFTSFARFFGTRNSFNGRMARGWGTYHEISSPRRGFAIGKAPIRYPWSTMCGVKLGMDASRSTESTRSMRSAAQRTSSAPSLEVSARHSIRHDEMSVEGRKKFEANVAYRKIDLQLGSRTVWIDGRDLEFSAEALSSSHLSLVVDGASFSVLVMAQDDGTYRVVVDGCEFDVRIKDERGLLLE